MRPNFAPGQSVKPRDTIEVLSFLTAKAKLRVAVGSKTYRYVAPAGVFARRVPLRVGSVDVKGSGGVKKFSVRSPWTVRNKFTVQDLQYRATSSYRVVRRPRSRG
jgi:hypothetical protein